MITEKQFQYLDELLKEALDHPDLSEWEQSFVEDMVDRLEARDVAIHITTRQQEMLDQIEGKIR